jgi:hypothetical protein
VTGQLAPFSVKGQLILSSVKRQLTPFKVNFHPECRPLSEAVGHHQGDNWGGGSHIFKNDAG